MRMTVGELKEMLAPYQDNNEIYFNVIEKELKEVEATLIVYIPSAKKTLLRDSLVINEAIW